jgi:hypothetical protein
MVYRSLVAHLLLLATSCSLLGCSRSDRPATFPVHGTATYRGKPVARASVAFLAAGAPRMAVGVTDERGTFRLTTFDPDDGAIPGTHVVTVRKLAPQAGPSYTASGDGNIDSAAIERAMQETAHRLEQAESAGSGLPAKYADHNTSDLRREVVEGDNEFAIELVD